jgi:3-phosphoshikimate 1-carboxyvinyltransferase
VIPDVGPRPSEPTSHPGTCTVRGGGSLQGSLSVPGDKSVSHRALLVAALAEGTSTITGLSGGDDVARTVSAVVAMGAGVDGRGPEVTVHGGRSKLSAPIHQVDLGNSGTGMRLVAGVAATLPGVTSLTGDASLRGRPMDRVAAPLRQMGARVDGRGERCLPPLVITGGALHGIEYTPPMASAQVKSAVLLAGLDADGETVVHEPVATRAHTEEMLAVAGADISVEPVGAGWVVRVRRSTLRPGSFVVPGDPSQAAFWVVGGVVVPDSLVTVTGIHLGAERVGFLAVLRRMGARIEVAETAKGTGTVTSRTSQLRGTVVESSEIPSLDEVPILAVAAARAQGTTRFRDVGELRVKESDRLLGTVGLVTSFGGHAAVEGDDLVVTGSGGTWHAGRIDARGDHRMAMAAAIAGAACPTGGEVTTITGWESVATSYPGFAQDLERLQAGGGPSS